MHVLESPLHADFAFIKAERGDRWGNLNYRKTARNFGPVMAMAARTTVATVHEVVPLGALDPESIVTPGIFEIGRAHVCTPVTNAHLVCRLLLAAQNC